MHWLTIGLPIVLVSPIIGLMLSVPCGLAFMMLSSCDHAHPQLVVCVRSLSHRWAWGRASADADCGRAHDAAALILGTQWTYAQGATGHGYALGALLSFTSIVIPWATAGRFEPLPNDSRQMDFDTIPTQRV